MKSGIKTDTAPTTAKKSRLDKINDVIKAIKIFINERSVIIISCAASFIAGMIFMSLFLGKAFKMGDEDKIYILKVLSNIVNASVIIMGAVTVLLIILIYMSRKYTHDTHKDDFIFRSMRDIKSCVCSSHAATLLVGMESFEITAFSQTAYDHLGLKNFFEPSNDDCTQLKIKLERRSGITLFDVFENNMVDSSIFGVLGDDERVDNAEVLLKPIDMQQTIVKVSARPVRVETEGYMVVSILDVTAFEESSHKLKIIYDVDRATGLVSKTSGRNLLADVYEEYANVDSNIVIIAIKTDNVQTVGYIHGMDESDWYLKAVADAIRLNIRSNDIVFRESNDEMLFMARNCSVLEAKSLVKRIRMTITEANRKNRKPYKMDIKAGMCDIKSNPGKSLDEIVETALNNIDVV